MFRILIIVRRRQYPMMSLHDSQIVCPWSIYRKERLVYACNTVLDTVLDILLLYQLYLLENTCLNIVSGLLM